MQCALLAHIPVSVSAFQFWFVKETSASYPATESVNLAQVSVL